MILPSHIRFTVLIISIGREYMQEYFQHARHILYDILYTSSLQLIDVWNLELLYM